MIVLKFASELIILTVMIPDSNNELTTRVSVLSHIYDEPIPNKVRRRS